MNRYLLLMLCCFVLSQCFGQQGNPKDTEVWEPIPKKVDPGKTFADAPSDAFILFDGKNLNEWRSAKDTTKAAGWIVENGVFTVKKRHRQY